MKDDTLVVTAGRHPEANHGVVNPPVYHASTIVYPTLAEWEAARDARTEGARGVFYRFGTTTARSLEEALTVIEDGYRALLYPCGLAAIGNLLSAYVSQGDHILVTDAVYGPTRAFCNNVLKRFGVETTFYDPLIGGAIEDLIRPETKLVYLESPGSLTFEIQDVAAIAEAAHRHDVIVATDNTWASPLYFKPLRHGCDISLHSGTKYISGHSDMMLGAVIANERAWPGLWRSAQEFGQTAAPDDIYLGQRGLRTLSVRLARHGENSLTLAAWLKAQPQVARVMHPALPDDPGHELWKRDFSGASGLFGVTLHPCSRTALAAFIDGLELFHIGASWGGYESLVQVSDPNTMRTATRWPYEGPTVRFHAGLEASEDLIRDLEVGLRRLDAAAD